MYVRGCAPLFDDWFAADSLSSVFTRLAPDQLDL
jgi:hypothetical protein